MLTLMDRKVEINLISVPKGTSSLRILSSLISAFSSSLEMTLAEMLAIQMSLVKTIRLPMQAALLMRMW